MSRKVQRRIESWIKKSRSLVVWSLRLAKALDAYNRRAAKNYTSNVMVQSHRSRKRGAAHGHMVFEVSHNLWGIRLHGGTKTSTISTHFHWRGDGFVSAFCHMVRAVICRQEGDCILLSTEYRLHGKKDYYETETKAVPGNWFR